MHDADPPDPRPRDAFATRAVHAGAEPDEATGAVSPPIYQTSTFAQDGVGRPRGGYEYARSQNPTRERLERAVADLEGGRHGIAFASGSATTAAIAQLAGAGDEILVGDDVYGGTYRYLERVHRPAGGAAATYVDLATGEDALWEGLTERTRLVWFESPSNPLLKITDIAASAATIRDRAAQAGQAPPLVVVDNTFASPALQRPLELGADIVFHSATKYLGGHSDAILGIAVTSDDAVAERLRFLQNAMGGVPGPFDCFLILRGSGPSRCGSSATAPTRRRSPGSWPAATTWHGSATRASPTVPTPIPGTRRPRARCGSATSPRSAAWCRSPWPPAVGRSQRRRAGRRGLRVGPAVHPGRVAGQRGVADRGARGHDAPLGLGVRARGRPGPRAALGRDRGRRRPDRGPACRRSTGLSRPQARSIQATSFVASWRARGTPCPDATDGLIR